MPRRDLQELLRLALAESSASPTPKSPDMDFLADHVASAVARRLGMSRRSQLEILADLVASRLSTGRTAPARRFGRGGLSASPTPMVSASPIPAVSASPIPSVAAASPGTPVLRGNRTLTDADVEAVAAALVRRLGPLSASPIPVSGVVATDGPVSARVDALRPVTTEGPVSGRVRSPSSDASGRE